MSHFESCLEASQKNAEVDHRKRTLILLGKFANVTTMKSIWTRLWPFVRPYKGPLIVALILGFILGNLSVVVPALAQVLISALNGKNLMEVGVVVKTASLLGLSTEHSIFSSTPQDIVRFVAFTFPIFYLIFGLVRYFHYYLIKYIGEKIVSNLRTKLMDKFMDLDIMFFSKQGTGSGGLLSRTLNDTLVLQQGFNYYGDLIREPIIATFLIGYMFYINWPMTAACFIFLPVFAWVIRTISRSLKKFGHQSQEALEEVTKTLKEGLDGVRIIQSFNLQGRTKEKFYGQVDAYLNKRRKIIKREELASPINEFLAAILFCGVCLFQADLIWSGQSDVATFISFLIAAGMLQAPIKKTQQAIVRVQLANVALDRLYYIFDSETKVVEAGKPKPFPKDWQSIQFQGVHFSYKDNKVLDDINLEIKRGEVVAIVGASGSGKTTLVNLLQRFFDPNNGNIQVGSTSIKEIAIQDLRKQIGLVTQDVFLFDDSVENNIWYGDLNRDKAGVTDAAKMANATFIETMPEGFQSFVGERGGRLSGGEKQRISIARAIFKDPPILILDEATSALDSASELEVQKGINELLKGRTALVIAHRLSTIIHSDRILVMKDGKVIEEGDHESLIAKNGEYAHFYSLQFQA